MRPEMLARLPVPSRAAAIDRHRTLRIRTTSCETPIPIGSARSRGLYNQTSHYFR